MWNIPPYFDEILDPEAPGVDKYISLVSNPDSGKDTEVHHIVPVAYFKDVLGRTDCRMAGAPDMNPVNLVPLSKGRHVLAHFYLAKYAKKCIAVQMRNAFCQTYQTTDFSKVTEEEVLSRIDEINAEYARLKNAKKEHKDGVEIRRTKTSVSLNNWKDGKRTGISAHWGVNGNLRGMLDTDTGDSFTCLGWKDKPYGFMMYGRSRGNLGYGLYIDVRDYLASGITPTPTRGYLRVHYEGRVLELMDTMSYGSYKIILSSYPGKIYYGNEVWEHARTFLHRKSVNRAGLSGAIRSVRKYSEMVGIVLSDSFSFMLSQLEDCAFESEQLKSYDVPTFPEPTKKVCTDFDRVDKDGLWLTQVRDGKRVAHYNWWRNGRINGIVQEGLPSVYFDGMYIQVNGSCFHIPKTWNVMSDEERIGYVQQLFPALAALNPIPPKPEPGGRTKIPVAA